MLFRRPPRQPSIEDRARARQAAVSWARTIARDRNILYLDTETTGLDGTAEIIEIAVLDTSGRVLLDTLVRPQGPIPAEARAVHGISDAMVAGAPEWADVYVELSAILHERSVVVYNAEFDLRLVQQMNQRHGINAGHRGWHCAMQQYAGFAGVWHERYGNFRWHRLDQAVAYFGHPSGGHRAAADAAACRLVVEGMAGG